MTYQLFGSSDTAITGYGILNNGAMAVFKQSKTNEPNLYFRTYAMVQDSAGNYVEQFPIQLSGLTVGSDKPNQVINYGNDLLLDLAYHFLLLVHLVE